MTKRNKKPKGNRVCTTGGVRLLLGTPANARRTYCRILRAFANDELQEERYRALLFGMTGYLSYLRFEHDVAFGERLDALEKKLDAMQRGIP